MAFSKANLYDKEVQIMADYMRGFGHPARIETVIKLGKDGPCCVKDLAKLHPITGPSYSDHLEILRELGLVTYEEKYPYIYYEAVEENVEKAKRYLKALLESL